MRWGQLIAGGVLTLSVLGLALCPAAATACLLTGTASISVNGDVAQRNLNLPTTATIGQWATFVFPRVYATGQTLVFQEARGDLLRSLKPSALAHPFLWHYGDGTHSTGQIGQHTYTHPGWFTLTVMADYSEHNGARSIPSWFSFDRVRIQIVPGNQVWQDNLGDSFAQGLSALWAAGGRLFDVMAVVLVVWIASVEVRERIGKLKQKAG